MSIDFKMASVLVEINDEMSLLNIESGESTTFFLILLVMLYQVKGMPYFLVRL